MENLTLRSVRLGPAPCPVDLGDGSERGEYVNQDYILTRLGRPHRGINLMYCYYPLDQGWPARASEAFPNTGDFAWGYPYDDYPPYGGGPGGDTTGEPFVSMRDVRRHGQDVILTLTIDPRVGDEHLAAIARELRPFGRMMLRINHEADGNWFAFNKRCSYQEVGDFFVRFHRIVKREAPLIKTIFCIGGAETPDQSELARVREFAGAIQAADFWSVDRYMALHWGWPFQIAEPGGRSHKIQPPAEVYQLIDRSHELLQAQNGGAAKPMVLSEFSADGDVTGMAGQVGLVETFYDLLRENKPAWCAGITFYQFRDRGRLGLECEDPNNSAVGVEQPMLAAYRRIIAQPFFSPAITPGQPKNLPARLRWGGAEDADGLAVHLSLARQPVFCEATFTEPLNLMLSINRQWFYKAPATKTIDLMPAFFARPLPGPTELDLFIFAPPPTGENDPGQGDGWDADYYTEMTHPPALRVRYEPAAEGRYVPD